MKSKIVLLKDKVLGCKSKAVEMMYWWMLVLMFIACVAYLVFYNYSLRANARTVDDYLTSSLLGSAIINIDEYGRDRQIVIADGLPASYEAYMDSSQNGLIVLPNGSELFNSNIYNASEFQANDANREYLNRARDKFTELIKINLELDDSMVPVENGTISRLIPPEYKDSSGTSYQNKFTIEEYTVINKYHYKQDGVDHTYTCVYRSTNGSDFQLVTSLSGVDKVTEIVSYSPDWNGVVSGGKVDGITVSETSVYARMKFHVYLGKTFGVGETYREEEVDRLVSIETK